MVVLQVNEVTKYFGEKTAVDHISFEVKQGEIFGLLGGNGAGKTTTMRMVLGLIYPDSGAIQWRGKGYSNELYRMMGYLPEERGLYPKVKVNEQILYLAELRGLSRKQADKALKEWLERFGVQDYYGKRVEELSKGNQQKIQFIAAVIHNPDILILDEAFSGLDPVNVELLKKTIHELRQQGKTILFSSHRMDHVEELCEHICILHKSKTVAKGSIKELKRAYPRERVILETEQPVDGIEALPGVVGVNRHQAGYDITITDEAAGDAILRHALTNSRVNRFQVMEPSLNEIFIRLVGGQHE